MKRVQHEKCAIRRKCNMEKAKHKKSATQKKWSMKIALK